jgi:hypothetical protein
VHRGDIRLGTISESFFTLEVSMNSPEQTTRVDPRYALVADRTAKLKAQLFELEGLREQVGQAMRSAKENGFDSRDRHPHQPHG